MDIVDTVLSILIMIQLHGNSVDPTSVFALPLLVIE